MVAIEDEITGKTEAIPLYVNISEEKKSGNKKIKTPFTGKYFFIIIKKGYFPENSYSCGCHCGVSAYKCKMYNPKKIRYEFEKYNTFTFFLLINKKRYTHRTESYKLTDNLHIIQNSSSKPLYNSKFRFSTINFIDFLNSFGILYHKKARPFNA